MLFFPTNFVKLYCNSSFSNRMVNRLILFENNFVNIGTVIISLKAFEWQNFAKKSVQY